MQESKTPALAAPVTPAAGELPAYRVEQSYAWNYRHAPAADRAPNPPPPPLPGRWTFLGRQVDSPLGVAAGPLLNGAWCLYYARLGFDLLTYKTVRSRPHPCYDLPNLVPVDCPPLLTADQEVPASAAPQTSWAVSYGMPSQSPDVWRRDVEQVRAALGPRQLLGVSVVGTMQPTWGPQELASDYAHCARWALDSGADYVEANFSCPNVCTRDGQLYQQAESAGAVAATVRGAMGAAALLVIKIGLLPGADAAEALLRSLAPHVDAVATTNSVAAHVRGADGTRMFDGQQRGICGGASRAASLRQVRLLSGLVAKHRLPLKVVGVGGIFSAGHVDEYLQAGAETVQLATAVMQDPAVGLRIRREIAEKR